jgi:hypothetical protein
MDQMSAEARDAEARAQQRRIGYALSEVERSINEALIIIAGDDPHLRGTLLTFRGRIRSAAGEGES